MTRYEWAVLDADGSVLDRYESAEKAYEATYEGGYPDGVTVAFVNEWDGDPA